MRESLHTKILLINLATALVLAIGLELILSFWLRYPGYIPDFLAHQYSKFYESADRDILQVTPCAEYDPDFFYRFKTGDCVFKNREFNVVNSYNSLGLRDDEGSLNHPSVLVLGDSYTMGWGVAQNEAYPQQLEALYGEKVLNAGVSSFGTAREMKLLKKINLPHINTVIIQYHPNDFEENEICVRNSYILPIRPERTYDSIREMIAYRNRYFPFKYLSGITKGVARSILFPEKKEVPGDTLEARLFLDILLNAGLQEMASRILVFKIDAVNTTNGFVDAVNYLLATEQKYGPLSNLTTIPMEGLFTKEDFFILDTHIRESGHEKVAATLNGYLDKRDATFPLLARTDR